MGVTLIDIGGGTADIIAFSEGNISFTEVFPMAGEYLTKDLASILRISIAEAERVKKQYGYVGMESEAEESGEEISLAGLGGSRNVKVSKEQIATIIQDRVDEIFENIRFELTKLGYWCNMSAGVVLTGGTANLKGIDKRASEILEVPVRVGYPGDDGGTVDMLKSPEYSAITGLVKYMATLDSSRRGAGVNLKWFSWLKDILG